MYYISEEFSLHDERLAYFCLPHLQFSKHYSPSCVRTSLGEFLNIKSQFV